MDDAAKPRAEDETADALARAKLIDALMAGPVKERPVVTILGDDVVTGFNPPATDGPERA